MDSRQKRLMTACITASLALVAMHGQIAQAATISLNASDSFGKSSFNGSGFTLPQVSNWSDNSVPSSGNDYANASFILRTPADGNDYTFQGNSLVLSGTGSNGLALKGNGTGETITINNLQMTNGAGSVVEGYSNGAAGAHTSTLAGNIALAGGTTASNSPSLRVPANANASAGVSTLNITATITGDSSIRLISQAAFNGTQSIVLAHSNSYTGGTFIGYGGSNDRGIIFRATVDGALGTGDVQYLATNGSIELTGGVTNNYIADTATLTLPSGMAAGSVNLNYSGTDNVGSLVIAGTTYTSGVFGATATNPGGIFTGSGLLAVPEPTSMALLGLAGMLALGRHRKSRA